MSCYAILRPKRKYERATVLVFPNPMLRSTFLGATVEARGEYEACTAKEAYKYMHGAEKRRTNVLHMQIAEYWDDEPYELAIERGLGHLFD